MVGQDFDAVHPGPDGLDQLDKLSHRLFTVREAWNHDVANPDLALKAVFLQAFQELQVGPEAVNGGQLLEGGGIESFHIEEQCVYQGQDLAVIPGVAEARGVYTSIVTFLLKNLQAGIEEFPLQQRFATGKGYPALFSEVGLVALDDLQDALGG